MLTVQDIMPRNTLSMPLFLGTRELGKTAIRGTCLYLLNWQVASLTAVIVSLEAIHIFPSGTSQSHQLTCLVS